MARTRCAPAVQVESVLRANADNLQTLDTVLQYRTNNPLFWEYLANTPTCHRGDKVVQKYQRLWYGAAYPLNQTSVATVIVQLKLEQAVARANAQIAPDLAQ